MTQLADLSKPFSSNLVHGNPSGGGHYVKHHVVNQRLLLTIGPFDFELVQIVRGFVPGKAPNPQGSSPRAKAGTPALHDAVVGAVCRLRCTVDGQLVTIEEAGDCEEPNNWPHDGARMKDAMSDAFKRCAMRLGLGLHLWSNEEYFLDKQLAKQQSADSAGRETATDQGKGDDREASTASTASPKDDDGKAGTEPQLDAVQVPAGPVMSAAQSKAIFALLRRLNVGDDERHEYCGAILDRDLTSFTSITAGEAKVLIDTLQTHVDAQKARAS